jgi:hypothetical protein
MRSVETNDLKKKILSGIELAFKKLVETKSKEDGELVFSKDGKIIKIKARDLQKT